MNTTTFNRIQELDALRGIALFGILIVNIFVFHAPLCHFNEFYSRYSGIESLITDTVAEYAAGKFLFLFAFLFGYGIVLQQNKYGQHFTHHFIRRMLVLLLIGILHVMLFWYGDILTSYAILGLLVLPVIRLPQNQMLMLSLFLIFFRPLYYVGINTFHWPVPEYVAPASLERFIRTYQEGDFLNIMRLRINEFMAFIPESLVWFIPKTFGLFLLGTFSARKRLIPIRPKFQSQCLIIGSALVLLGILWFQYRYAFFNLFNLETEPYWRPMLIAINVLFETTLGLGYLLVFVAWVQSNKRIRKALGDAGRLALSNYLIQSLICSFLFYGYGLGWYGKMQPSELIILSVLIFTLNLVFSSYYLRFFSHGPIEYLWRRLAGYIK